MKKKLVGLLLAMAAVICAALNLSTGSVEASTLPVGKGSTFVFDKAMTILDDDNNDDKDSYYTMNIRKSGYFEVHCIKNELAALEIRDEDNNVIFDDYWYGGGEGLRVYLRAGKYAVRARGWGDCECVFYWYTAKETFADGFSKNNDSDDSATFIKAADMKGTLWTGMMSANDDYDWYRFTMKNKGKLAFTLKDKTEDVNAKYMLTKGNGKFVADSSSSELQDGKVVFTLNKGTYLLRISSEKAGIYNFKMKVTYPSIYTWKTTAKGRMYVDQYGKYIKSKWKVINGKTYYFNKSGIAVTGWKKIGGSQYYFNKSGVMITGMKTIKGKTYFFNKKGVMLTGWVKIDGDYYHFSKKGAMQKGWLRLGKKWYYLEDGKRVTGSRWINDKYYYFKDNGTLEGKRY